MEDEAVSLTLWRARSDRCYEPAVMPTEFWWLRLTSYSSVGLLLISPMA